MPHVSQRVLVVGASSGIGQATAAALAARGHRVFGTSRDAARVTAPGVAPIPLDVMDDALVERGVRAVVEAAGGLDAVIYSAGFYIAGAVEETTVDQVRDQFEVFLFGAHRVTRAALPHLRASGRGRLLYMSSSASVAAIPYHAAYAASKAALEHYCDGLRYEVEPQGIAVSCVQATGVNTGAAAAVHLAAEPVAIYEPTRREAVERFQRTQTEGPPPTAIVEALVAAVEAERPRPVIRVGREAKLLPWLKTLAPERLFRAQVLKAFVPHSS